MIKIDNETLFPLKLTLRDSDVIAVGVLTKQRGTVPYRIVLRILEPGKFVVHYQHMDLNDHGIVSHRCFHHGDYFEGTDAFARAVQCFGNRVVRDAGNCGSIEEDQKEGNAMEMDAKNAREQLIARFGQVRGAHALEDGENCTGLLEEFEGLSRQIAETMSDAEIRAYLDDQADQDEEA